MESLAHQLLQLGSYYLLSLALLLITASGGVAVLITRLDWKLNTPLYILAMAALFVIAVFCDVLIADVFATVNSDNPTIVVAAAIGGLVVIGALAGIASAARSMDAYGSRKNWFLGFIPGVNILFSFETAEGATKAGYEETSGSVLFALIMIGAGVYAQMNLGNYILPEQARSRYAKQEIDNTNLLARFDSEGVEPVLKHVAAITPVDIKIDDDITLVGVFAEGKTIVYHYLLPRKTTYRSFEETYKSKQMEWLCSPAKTKWLLDIGAAMQARYFNEWNAFAEVGTLDINPATCNDARMGN